MLVLIATVVIVLFLTLFARVLAIYWLTESGSILVAFRNLFLVSIIIAFIGGVTHPGDTQETASDFGARLFMYGASASALACLQVYWQTRRK